MAASSARVAELEGSILSMQLVQLIARRNLFSAQQAPVSVVSAEQINRVTLYMVLGGGWVERGR